MIQPKPATISNLIAALQIFLRYGDITFPTGCEHDTLRVYVNPAKVTAEDKEELAMLRFQPDTEFEDCFVSYSYGSA